MRIENWSFAFTGSWPVLLVLIGAAAGAGLAGWFYRRRRAALPRWYYAALVGLRTALVLLLALFILRPVLRFSRSHMGETEIAVLVDVSRSMSIKDSLGGRSRLAAAEEVLTGKGNGILRGLEQIGKVRLFAFDNGLEEMDRAGLDALKPEGEETAIGGSLKALAERMRSGGLSGVVLLSDGVSTTGGDAVKVARTLGVPIFPVALGGKLGREGRFLDIAVRRVPMGRDFIVNNKATVPVAISNTGLEGLSDAERLVRVVLSEEGKEVASSSVLLGRLDTVREVDLEFVPKRTGVFRYEVSLPVLPGEIITENNRRAFTLRITDPKIRTLYVEGVIRPEYKFLRRTLESDPNVTFTGVVKTRADRFLVQGVVPKADLSRGLPEKKEGYADFDVVILGDIAAGEFTPAQLKLLDDFVSSGGGLMALGGYHSFGGGGWQDSPLAAALPVVMGGPKDGQTDKEFQLRLTDAGRASPIFAGCAEFFDAANPQYGLLGGANRVRGQKPGAEVLAVHPTEKVGAEPMPIAVVQRYGAGRVLALMVDTTWRWKFQVGGRGLDSPYYRFWGQAIRWLAQRKTEFEGTKQQLALWMSKPEYGPDEDVQVQARVRNKDGSPEDGADITVELTAPGGRGEKPLVVTQKMMNIPLSQGEYELTWQPKGSGVYTVKATAAVRGEKVGEETTRFIVGKPTDEFDNVDVDEQLLRSLAEESGGRYHTVLTARTIPDELEARRKRIMERVERNIWNWPTLCFTLFLGLVTLEWIARKRRHLV